MTSKRVILSVAVGVVGLVATYAYFRVQGVEISTTTDAFATPSESQPQIVAKDGSVRNIIGVTPAPWPEEAGDIYRLARFRIPVKVVLSDSRDELRFIIVGLNEDGNLIIENRSRQDADLIMAKLRGE